MSKSHFVAVAAVLWFGLGVAACQGPPVEDGGSAPEESALAAALREAGAIERLGETRWAPRVSERASAPILVVDASWPQPLPNDWRIGQVG
jgi:hypothetical protein